MRSAVRPTVLALALIAALAGRAYPAASVNHQASQEAAGAIGPDLGYLTRARTLLAASDSFGALAVLDTAVTADPRNASAWHLRGIVAWALSWNTAPKSIERLRLVHSADVSLENAATLASDSAIFLVDRGRFFRAAYTNKMRGKAKGFFERALALARRQNDHASYAAATDELGLIEWRNYERDADRHIYSTTEDPRDQSLIKDARAIQYFIDNLGKRASSQEWSGRLEYTAAYEHFTDAFAHDPHDESAFRHVLMTLVDRQRWMEIDHITRQRLLAQPEDGWAWMARGLAEHRLHYEADASAAFDSGLARISGAERAHIDRIERILRPRDTTAQSQIPPDERIEETKLYWLMVDPLWLTPGNEHRLEFLSRVTFAQLRWSVPEYHLEGVDTDQGDMFVRYGPPPAVISWPVNVNDQRSGPQHDVRILWWYAQDVAFLFKMTPGYGLTQFESGDGGAARQLQDTVPVTWSNLGIAAAVDTIPVQVARFRSSNDSADVYVAAQIPVGHIVKGIDLENGAVLIGFNAYTWQTQRVVGDSSRELLRFASAPMSTLRTWRERIPVGVFYYRVEALQPASMQGARAANRIDVPAGSGFGISDILLADAIHSPTSEDHARWSDYTYEPNVSRVQRGRSFSLLWETYALGAKEGDSHYRVSITLARKNTSGRAGRILASILSGARGAVGLANNDDALTLTYENARPQSPAAVDHLALQIGEAPAGEYTLTVKITDLVTNEVTQRSTSLTVVE